jgi:uncharacterized protein (UPF0333 family)
MDIIKDDAAQTSAEMILLFGGIIVVVVVAALFYRNYLNGLGSNITNGTDLNNTLNGINNLNKTVS